MLSTDQILEEAARDGSIDIAEWPRVLENVLQRLHNIVYTDFPLPSIPLPAPLPSTIDPEVVASTPPQAAGEPDNRDPDITLPDADDDTAPTASQSSTKENDAPSGGATVKPPVPKFDEQRSPQQSQQQTDSIEPPSGTLPPDLLSSYQASTRVLQGSFAQSPPYTIQRLAELVLYPRKHYRFLPAYLRALDRVIAVSSPVSDFPLPSGINTANGGFLTNGDSNGAQEREGLGSDESLGGALLTPIPWLRNSNGLNSGQGDGELHSEGTETIQGPNGAGSIETEAGVVPVAQTAPRRTLLSTSAAAVGRETPSGDVVIEGSPEEMEERPEEHPHARGPDVIGMEDMGPQQHPLGDQRIDMEAAVGRHHSPPLPASEAEAPDADAMLDDAKQDDAGKPGQDPADFEKDIAKLKETSNEAKEEAAKDSQGDVVVGDADGRSVDEIEKDEPSANSGEPDAADATAQ
ncbi:hypothetical protein WHR41_06207 [Cladosporium halotolerans]|uniref:Protein phosphatase 4 core regulatory subunit R2 n=1 Tax=Cladosporium halotolerans TaxID=1052096 RepID=A0AB34KLP8_9PEZI